LRSDSVFSASSLQAHLSLVLLCGSALALSIQPASRIATLHATNASYPSGMFHLVSVLVFGLFAVSRGAIIAAGAPPKIRPLKLVTRLLEHITYGLLLLLPFFIFSRALLPGRLAGVAVLVSYVAISSIFYCLISFRLEIRGNRQKRGAFLLRYGVYAAFCLLPLGVGMSHQSLSLAMCASPIGFAIQVIRGISATELLLGFLVPCLGILWLLTRRHGFDRRPHAV